MADRFYRKYFFLFRLIMRYPDRQLDRCRLHFNSLVPVENDSYFKNIIWKDTFVSLFLSAFP